MVHSSRRRWILHGVIVIASVAVALMVGNVSLHTLERWVTPVAALLVSHIGALVLLIVLLRWRFRRSSGRPSDSGS